MTAADGAARSGETGAARRTVQRDAVLAALRSRPAFTSAQALYEAMRSMSVPVALATVYRHLNAFVDAGKADTIWRDGHQLFRACEITDRHHHVVCTSCGAGADIRPPLDWLNEAVEPGGFSIDHVVLEVSGRCRDCRQSQPG